MLTGDGQRLETCWRYFNPPRRLANANFNNYKPKTRQQAEALERCQAYSISDIKQGKGLFLFGSWGTGKSHLSVAVTRALMEANPLIFGTKQQDWIWGTDEHDGIYCSFFSVVDLLEAMRPGSEAKKRKGDWLFHRAKIDDLVVLDDIGAERVTDWVEEKLYAIVDVRYRMERATIFTSNCKEKELVNHLGGRVVSRIYEMTEQIPVLGPDHRRKLA